MLRIVKAAAIAASAIALLAFSAAPALAATQAQTLPLLADSFGNCASGAVGGTPTGTTTIAKYNGTVYAEGSVTHVSPNHTYTLEIVQTPSGSGCFVPQASFTTSSEGNGSFHVHVAAAAGTTDAFVMINPSDQFGYITSMDAVFPPTT